MSKQAAKAATGWITILVATVALSGCVSEVQVPDEGRDTWFAFGSHGLEEQSSTNEQFPVNWGWQDYAGGIAPPSWSSGSFTAPAYVTEATLTITFHLRNVGSVDAPVRPFSRPPLTAWFGVDDSIIEHVFAEGPAAATDDAVTAMWELRLPEGGMYVPEDGVLRVFVGSYYGHYDGVHLDASSSRLDVHLEPAIALPPATSSQEATVQVAGAACIVRDPSGNVDATVRGAAIAAHQFALDPSAVGLQVDASTLGGDMDFWIQDAAGNQVAHALGPGNQETITLGPASLVHRDGPWSVHAYACSLTDGTIDLTIRQFGSPEFPG